MATSEYGRCVFHCDNDVVDHQVVSFEFAGGATGTFTMTAFGRHGRQTRLHGTEGFLRSDGSTIDVWGVRNGLHTQINVRPSCLLRRAEKADRRARITHRSA